MRGKGHDSARLAATPDQLRLGTRPGEDPLGDRDLRHHLFRPDVFSSVGSVPVERLLTAVPVQQVMSSPVISVDPEAGLEEAARRMREDKLGSLPVVDEGRIVGIITETDLLRRIVGADAGAADVEAIVVSYP